MPRPSFDQRTSEPVVSFRFDGKGAQRFGQATQQNVGRLFAIILDNQVISAPQIREPILGGSGQISGNFTAQSANDLAVLLRAGALPATLNIIEERTVGPGLGQDSIDAGKISGIIGGILVVAFMMLAYGFLGVIANIALAANVAMIVAILSLLGATLTLPGIAGIVLTVGMAVDSNVLIYERIQEERRAGRSVIQAIDTGFAKALATIVDTNVTTLIAAAVLFWLGTGPVKGFAVTFAIGIVTTVFTAFTLTRWLVAEWVKRAPSEGTAVGTRYAGPAGHSDPVHGHSPLDLRTVDLAVDRLGRSFRQLDMNYGVDFKGGSIIELKARDGSADPADIRARLSELNIGDVQVQEIGRRRRSADPCRRAGRRRQRGTIGGQQSPRRTAERLRLPPRRNRRADRLQANWRRTVSIGIVVALALILVYVWFRFEWQFAVGAIIATIHDIVMTIGFFVVSGIEFNQSSIAAILTIVGYSLNDTVVVYDRVREDLRRYKKMPLPQLLNNAINETLSRTTLTSVTTMLALLALFIFGGEVIRSFTAAMLFGVVFGTYSSIFIAAPLLILFHLRPGGAGVDEEKPAVTDKALATR